MNWQAINIRTSINQSKNGSKDQSSKRKVNRIR